MFRNAMFIKYFIGIFLFALIIIYGCSSTETPSTSSNTPSDHTVNKNGKMHKTGLNNPLTNCISCHGNDLKGGTSGKSCYSCHGQKW